ncbi:MAG: hypothetical protein COT81_02445 [Candidatus Buchananbacteria bacterium CG10_big_fil_rev_8_21_14_0_10_42_9]|uniref:Thioredoxin domain-containing protein n=1 Tax=Candidatus Buchananbacteria bacterium CG10_big_fil_rev_8_21_14_0_10_42_9 TaxID=1974526 RepID=A0A2H0W1I0_9BACT|nr:MAG: hypothetical protein COT81_02445 [Candidatus Buchananbacteria bacterium CG10_big_fil_rev_8_21_14_0_10_42_9]
MFVGIILALGVIYYIYSGTKPGTYDAFAECLGESGTTFYGAFWCPHCQSQKSKFGRSEKKLPYVECSQPNGQGQTKVCIDAGIESYPTWEFPDGTRETGDLSLPYLAEKTGCELPN